MVAVATQNIIKEAKKKKLGRDNHDANLDPDKEIQNTRRIKKVLMQQDITLDSFHMFIPDIRGCKSSPETNKNPGADR